MTPHKGLTLGGRYELKERVAVGGMGEVWTAADLHLERRVAAKVLRAEFAGDKSFLARMRAEARNAAGLTHTNVSAMYDYGEQEGSSYLIMELVEGEPMSELLAREKTLAPGQLLPILAQTARGLHAAHVAGVVHRDVKPSNLLITRDGTVKITDFGIALGANQAPMTAAGMVMGTAQYLPPEQAMGKAAQGVGDIYALGVIAYESLVGRRPFTGSTQVDIAFAHVNQPVPPMPDTIDPRVRDLVMSMLDKDPEKRPRSGASLARMLDALQRQLHAEDVVAGNPERPSHGAQVAAMPTQAVPTTQAARDDAHLAAETAERRRSPGPPRSASDQAMASAVPERARRPLVPPIVGTSALKIDALAEVAPDGVPAVVDVAPAGHVVAEAVVAEPVIAEPVAAEPVVDRRVPRAAARSTVPTTEQAAKDASARSAVVQGDDRRSRRAVIEKAAGVRRPAMPTRRAAAMPPVEVPPSDDAIVPQWSPIGARAEHRATPSGAPQSRPRRRRHTRAGSVWTWQRAVKVLVVLLMLTALVLWLGTLAEASVLAIGAIGVRHAVPTCDATPHRSGRRRPTSG